MPYLAQSSYPGPPLHHFNSHLQTILPNTLRWLRVPYVRERLELEDGDFLDLDWLSNDHNRLVILCHGLEGDSRRKYMMGMAQAFEECDWDVLAWHCRSCSEEMNRNFCLYYHGNTADITSVVDHVIDNYSYNDIELVGFSMGGSIVLKYLGTKGDQVPDVVRAGIAFSTPCDFPASERATEARKNRFYFRRFFRSLSNKVRIKDQTFPGRLDIRQLEKVRRWEDFDRHFSLPLNGFDRLEEFYYEASAKNFINGIRRPSLLINAINDPMLPDSCHPVELAKQHDYFYLETPSLGGHVGFATWRNGYWSEQRALEFVSQHT